jgi:diguanylate cyclase (GGDEF)-like protein
LKTTPPDLAIALARRLDPPCAAEGLPVAPAAEAVSTEPFADVDARSATFLSRENARLRAILERLDEGIVLVDAAGRVEHANELACRWLGVANGALVGAPAARWLTGPRSALQALSSPDGGPQASHALETRESFLVDSQGRVDGRIVRLCDVTDRQRLLREIERLSTRDEVTGLPNRRAFEHALAAAVEDARVRDTTHALVYLDLDEFKIVNDTGGHAAGDELLARLGQHLTTALALRFGPPAPADDARWMLARLGGDEFGLLLRDTDAMAASAQAERLQEKVHAFRFAWGSQTFRIGASIGIAAIDRQCGGVDALLQATDGACYMAKDAGRDRIRVHDLDDPELARRYGAMQWVSRIEAAFDDDRFCLYAQPIAPLHGEHTGLHFEVLLRLRDEQGAIALPGTFMPAVERYHLSARVDEWVLENTLRWLGARAPGEVSHCAINLSAHTVGDPGMLARIEALLDERPVPPGCLCFEITETAAIGHLAQAETFIRRLRARGCQVALDDFGSGMSSFAYLRQLPVDVLKIDGLFVRGVENDVVNQSMLRAIHEVARVMGLRTVAEFAETDATVDWLRALGLDHAQGYAIARPQPIDALLVGG